MPPDLRLSNRHLEAVPFVIVDDRHVLAPSQATYSRGVAY